MGRGVQISVAILFALEVVLLAAWVDTLLAGTGSGYDLRLPGVALFLAATATVITAIAVAAARPHWPTRSRIRR